MKQSDEMLVNVNKATAVSGRAKWSIACHDWKKAKMEIDEAIVILTAIRDDLLKKEAQ